MYSARWTWLSQSTLVSYCLLTDQKLDELAGILCVRVFSITKISWISPFRSYVTGLLRTMQQGAFRFTVSSSLLTLCPSSFLVPVRGGDLKWGLPVIGRSSKCSFQTIPPWKRMVHLLIPTVWLNQSFYQMPNRWWTKHISSNQALSCRYSSFCLFPTWFVKL